MKWTKSLLAATLSLTLTACAEIDCPLQNIVALRVGFYGADGAQIQLPDTLSILAAGTDSVLFNRGIAITRSFSAIRTKFISKTSIVRPLCSIPSRRCAGLHTTLRHSP